MKFWDLKGAVFLNAKRFLIIILVILVSLIGCSNNNKVGQKQEINHDNIDNVNETGMPIVKEPITLDIFAEQQGQANIDWNTTDFYSAYEDITGVKMNWEMVPTPALEEKKNLRLAIGDLPDAFHTVAMTDTDLMSYGEQGMFIRLNELIDDYAPNFKKLMEEYPEIKKSITMPDGGIYSFPSIESPEFISMRMAAKPFINKNWLETLDMEMPETTDDFYNYLKAVKETDLNGNGKADEIPYGAPHINNLLSWIKGSFGVGNRGFQHFFLDSDPETDELRFYPTTEQYKEMLVYVNKLYDEQLIDKDIFSMELDDFMTKAVAGRYGSMNWSHPENAFGEIGKEFVGAPALEGPHGDKLYIGIKNLVAQKGAFTITSENEHPAATVRWIDYFYGEEGIESFLTNSDANVTVSNGSPTIIKQEYFKGAENAEKELAAAELVKDNLIEEPWPSFPYTRKEIKELLQFGSDIEKYVREMTDKFIAGVVPFSEWDEYIETINDMGLDKYMDIQETAYERYLSH